MQSALEEDPRHQSAKGQQLPSEFYPELQVLWQLPPPRFEYQRLFQRNASSASLFVVFRMLEASLREFREYYVTTALKSVTNLSVFCARVS